MSFSWLSQTGSSLLRQLVSKAKDTVVAIKDATVAMLDSLIDYAIGDVEEEEEEKEEEEEEKEEEEEEEAVDIYPIFNGNTNETLNEWLEFFYYFNKSPKSEERKDKARYEFRLFYGIHVMSIISDPTFRVQFSYLELLQNGEIMDIEEDASFKDLIGHKKETWKSIVGNPMELQSLAEFIINGETDTIFSLDSMLSYMICIDYVVTKVNLGDEVIDREYFKLKEKRIEEIMKKQKQAKNKNEQQELEKELENLEKQIRVRKTGGFFSKTVMYDIDDFISTRLQRAGIPTTAKPDVDDTTPCLLKAFSDKGLIDETDNLNNSEFYKYGTKKMLEKNDIKYLIKFAPKIKELYMIEYTSFDKSTKTTQRSKVFKLINGENCFKGSNRKEIDNKYLIALFDNHYFAIDSPEDGDNIYNFLISKWKENKVVKRSNMEMPTEKEINIGNVIKEFEFYEEMKTQLSKAKEKSTKEKEEKDTDTIKTLTAQINQYFKQSSKDTKFQTTSPIVIAADCEAYPDENGVYQITMIAYKIVNIQNSQEIIHQYPNIKELFDKPSCLGRIIVKRREFHIPGVEFVEDMRILSNVTGRNIQIWFHNLKFDLSLIIKDNKFQEIIKQEGNVYSAAMINTVYMKKGYKEKDDKLKYMKMEKNDKYNQGNYYVREYLLPNQSRLTKKQQEEAESRRLKIEFRDFYKIHSDKLTNVAKDLGVASKLEYINYNWHTPERVINNSSCKLEDYLEDINQYKNEDIELWRKTLSKDSDNKGKPYNYIFLQTQEKLFSASERFKDYCIQDVEVLANCMERTNKIMNDITNKELDLCDVRTISSFSSKIHSKLFEGIWHPIGIARKYLCKMISGGRVNFNPKYARKIITELVRVIDYTSLYPSAILRCKENFEGFPKGIPIPFKPEEFEAISKTKLFYVGDFKITKIGRRFNFPYIRIIEKDNTLLYTDDITKIGDTVFTLDKLTYEDWKEFHQVEYECLGGLYYPEGYTAGEFSDSVEEILKKKDEADKNKQTALKAMYKLVVNSVYGSTIQKDRETVQNIIDTSMVMRELYRNRHLVSVEYLSEKQSLVKYDADNNTQVPCIIGIMILSMSKRIMNEIMSIIQIELESDVLYQDTDSVHFFAKDYDNLKSKYKEKYNKDLEFQGGKGGSKYGYSHQDYPKKAKEAYGDKCVSKASIYCGRKSYCELIGEEGNPNSPLYLQNAMKGISKHGLESLARKYGGETKELAMLSIYEEACEKPISIVMNPTDMSNVSMEYKGIGIVRNRREFIRSIHFK